MSGDLGDSGAWAALAAAVAAVWIGGGLLMRRLRLPGAEGAFFGPTALMLGTAALVWLMALMELCRIPLRAWTVLPAWGALVAGLAWCGRGRGGVRSNADVPMPERGGAKSLGATAIITASRATAALIQGWVAGSLCLAEAPGMGIYGYRAKLLFLLGNTPPGYYTSPGYDFSNPGYPPGWSLVALWFYLWRGGVDDH